MRSSRLLLLQQLCRGRRGPLVIDQARSRRFTELAYLLQNRDKAALTALAESSLIGADGKVQDADSGVLLQGEHLDVGVQHLDPQDPGDGLDGGGGEVPEVFVFGRRFLPWG